MNYLTICVTPQWCLQSVVGQQHPRRGKHSDLPGDIIHDIFSINEIDISRWKSRQVIWQLETVNLNPQTTEIFSPAPPWGGGGHAKPGLARSNPHDYLKFPK
jgi:hypothetical protein